MISSFHLLVCLFLLITASSGQQQPRRQLRHRFTTQHQNTINNPKTDIPPLEFTIEFAKLSNVVYDYHTLDYTSCTSQEHVLPKDSSYTNDTFIVLPENVTCEMYEHDKQQGTQVLIVTSSTKKYIAVIYAGTDDVQSTILDGAFLQTQFSQDVSQDILVHSGFHNAVFKDGIYDRVLKKVQELKGVHEEYRIVTSGHSLGAASSILTAAAFAPNFNSTKKEEDKILVINFGCPRIGNKSWQIYVDSLPNLSIYRFVLGRDIVPRVPPTFIFYHHVGHMLQMNNDEMLAYYSQNGDVEKKYAGVPFSWDMWPVVWLPGALVTHQASKYLEYLEDNSRGDEETFYVHDFERLNSTTATTTFVGEVDGEEKKSDGRDGTIAASFSETYTSSQ